jgi:hypothetical protein
VGAIAATVVDDDGDGDGLGDASQLTCTEVAPGSMDTVALPLAPACLLTVTTMVTLCPALSCPAVSLRVTSADEVLAAQVTAPPTALSTIWPCEPVPRLRLAGLTRRWPAGPGLDGRGEIVGPGGGDPCTPRSGMVTCELPLAAGTGCPWPLTACEWPAADAEAIGAGSPIRPPAAVGVAPGCRLGWGPAARSGWPLPAEAPASPFSTVFPPRPPNVNAAAATTAAATAANPARSLLPRPPAGLGSRCSSSGMSGAGSAAGNPAASNVVRRPAAKVR